MPVSWETGVASSVDSPSAIQTLPIYACRGEFGGALPSCPLLGIVVWCQVVRTDALVSPASPTLPACLCSGHEECQAPAFPRSVQRAPKYADFLGERDLRGWRTWSHFVSQASLSMAPGLVVTFRRALIGPGVAVAPGNRAVSPRELCPLPSLETLSWHHPAARHPRFPSLGE